MVDKKRTQRMQRINRKTQNVKKYYMAEKNTIEYIEKQTGLKTSLVCFIINKKFYKKLYKNKKLMI